VWERPNHCRWLPVTHNRDLLAWCFAACSVDCCLRHAGELSFYEAAIGFEAHPRLGDSTVIGSASLRAFAVFPVVPRPQLPEVIRKSLFRNILPVSILGSGIYARFHSYLLENKDARGGGYPPTKTTSTSRPTHGHLLGQAEVDFARAGDAAAFLSGRQNASHATSALATTFAISFRPVQSRLQQAVASR